jgi:hypothetical protein
MSLVASIGGVTLFPLYAQNMLTPAVVARPLRGEPPTSDLSFEITLSGGGAAKASRGEGMVGSAP